MSYELSNAEKASECGSFLYLDDTADCLIVVINSYVNHLYGGLKYENMTKQEMRSLMQKYHASFIWFAENKRHWYLEHEESMLVKLDSLINSAMTKLAKRVIIVGVSAGGYAGIRLGIRLRTMLVGRLEVDIRVVAINPQTAFVGGATESILSMPMDKMTSQLNCLGTDPVFLTYDDISTILNSVSPQDRSKWYNEINISDLISSNQSTNWPKEFIHVHYDSLNPIEKFYSEQIGGFSCVHLAPTPLGVRHSIGCNIIGSKVLRSNLLKSQHNATKYSFTHKLYNKLNGYERRKPEVQYRCVNHSLWHWQCQPSLHQNLT